MSVQFRLATPYASGPIAVIDLYGEGVGWVLHQLTGNDRWPVGSLRFCQFGDIDEGVVAIPGPDRAQLMPHGGLRVLQRLGEALIDLDCMPAPSDIDPELEYPEAESRDEALMLAALARAASPLALELLPAQPERWGEYRRLQSQRSSTIEPIEMIRQRAVRLNHLLNPPSVVIVGLPNVGKSTLTNALAGGSTSLAADLAGTTRDYVGVQLDLDGLVVRWYDTPGRPDGAEGEAVIQDEIISQALEISDQIIHQADLLIAAADYHGVWPATPTCVQGRSFDLRVLLKAELIKGWTPPGADVSVSVKRGLGLAGLAHEIRQRLVPETDVEHPGPWLFDERLLDDES